MQGLRANIAVGLRGAGEGHWGSLGPTLAWTDKARPRMLLVGTLKCLWSYFLPGYSWTTLLLVDERACPQKTQHGPGGIPIFHDKLAVLFSLHATSSAGTTALAISSVCPAFLSYFLLSLPLLPPLDCKLFTAEDHA